jgi:hypothetical protein
MLIGNRLISYLLITCLLLAVGLLLQFWNAADTTIPVSAESQRAAKQEIRHTVTTFNAPPIKSFDEILERPLFTPGREPPPEAVIEAAETTPVAPLRLQLEGVAITDDARIAVVRDLGTREILRLAEGNVHQGWVLEKVHTTGVRFRHGENTDELSLDNSGNSRHMR